MRPKLLILLICIVAALGGAAFVLARHVGLFASAATGAARTTPSGSGSSGTTLVEDAPVAPGFEAMDASGATAHISSTDSGPRTAPAGSKEYRNTTYHFSLFYPDSLQVTETDEGHGARTISFESADESQGFEIFVTPYEQRQVTKERFAMDEPSGVMQSPTAIVIGGTPATMFFGNNDVMGDTREVWFISGGYLYEVATYKPLDAWLSQIMSTWQFI